MHGCVWGYSDINGEIHATDDSKYWCQRYSVSLSIPTAVRTRHWCNSLTVPHPIYLGFTIESSPWLSDIAIPPRNWRWSELILPLLPKGKLTPFPNVGMKDFRCPTAACWKEPNTQAQQRLNPRPDSRFLSSEALWGSYYCVRRIRIWPNENKPIYSCVTDTFHV